MPVLPIEISEFGGLDLRDDPQEVGHAAAIDLMNVTLMSGRVRSRYGTTVVGAAALSAEVNALGYYAASNQVLASAIGAEVRAFDASNGTAGASLGGAAVTGGNNAFVAFGTPSSRRLYLATGAGLYRYDGTAYTAVTCPLTSPKLVAVSTPDNRLVVAQGNRVQFSDPGAPETFGTNNYVDLWPGDGEDITALVQWGSTVIAFKQSKYAVFYGTSTDSTGQPVFNYRSVTTGIGANLGAAVAGPDGVYFLNPGGVYRTQGNPPTYLSVQLEPWLRTGSFGSLPSINLSGGSQTAAFYENTLYLTDRASRVTLVLDTVLNGWSVWQNGATATMATPSFASTRGLFLGDASTLKVARVDSSATTDNGASITGRYRTGFFAAAMFSSSRTRRPYAWPGAEGRVREWLIDGAGAITVKTAHNDSTTLGAGAVAFGTGTYPTIKQGRDRRAVRGRNVSVELSGAAPWAISRVIASVDDSRGPSTQSE